MEGDAMSSDPIMRILCETDARLQVAEDADEVRRIGIDHVRALGADLAALTYLQLATDPSLNAEQQASLLMVTVGSLMETIEASFITQGVRDVALLADHLEAAEIGFVGRLDELFSAVRIGGHA
jgi:hypothetical protein